MNFNFWRSLKFARFKLHKHISDWTGYCEVKRKIACYLIVKHLKEFHKSTQGAMHKWCRKFFQTFLVRCFPSFGSFSTIKDAVVKICIAKFFFIQVNNVETVPFLKHFIKQFFKGLFSLRNCSPVNFPIKMKWRKKEKRLWKLSNCNVSTQRVLSVLLDGSRFTRWLHLIMFYRLRSLSQQTATWTLTTYKVKMYHEIGQDLLLPD